MILLKQIAIVRGERHDHVAQVAAQFFTLKAANNFPR